MKSPIWKTCVKYLRIQLMTFKNLLSKIMIEWTVQRRSWKQRSMITFLWHLPSLNANCVWHIGGLRSTKDYILARSKGIVIFFSDNATCAFEELGCKSLHDLPSKCETDELKDISIENEGTDNHSDTTDIKKDNKCYTSTQRKSFLVKIARLAPNA